MDLVKPVRVISISEFTTTTPQRCCLKEAKVSIQKEADIHRNHIFTYYSQNSGTAVGDDSHLDENRTHEKTSR